MKLLIFLIPFIFIGCVSMPPIYKKTNVHNIYEAVASGNNRTKMKRLYKIVINDANALCKSKKRKYIQIISLTDESGVGYDSFYLHAVHFKRPALHLSFSCVNIKKSRVILVK